MRLIITTSLAAVAFSSLAFVVGVELWCWGAILASVSVICWGLADKLNEEN